MEIELQGKFKNELRCAINDVLDKYLINNIAYMKSYICPSSKNILIIRVPGATRGSIELSEENTIKAIHLSSYACFGKEIGCFYRFKRKKLQKELEQFVGAKILMPHKGIGKC